MKPEPVPARTIHEGVESGMRGAGRLIGLGDSGLRSVEHGEHGKYLPNPSSSSGRQVCTQRDTVTTGADSKPHKSATDAAPVNSRRPTCTTDQPPRHAATRRENRPEAPLGQWWMSVNQAATAGPPSVGRPPRLPPHGAQPHPPVGARSDHPAIRWKGRRAQLEASTSAAAPRDAGSPDTLAPQALRPRPQSAVRPGAPCPRSAAHLPHATPGPDRRAVASRLTAPGRTDRRRVPTDQPYRPMERQARRLFHGWMRKLLLRRPRSRRQGTPANRRVPAACFYRRMERQARRLLHGWKRQPLLSAPVVRRAYNARRSEERRARWLLHG